MLDRRRTLRREATMAEAAIWRRLRGRRFAGLKFRRQPCGPYILDFFCAERALAIELDGSQHLEPAGLARDERRTSYLRKQGITVLRFGSDVALREPRTVLLTIALALDLGDHVAALAEEESEE